MLANAKEAEKKQSEKKTEKKAGWTLCCCPPKTIGDICVFVPNEILFPLNTHTVDGKNAAPVDMVNIPLSTGFFTSQVVIAGFLNHQQSVKQLIQQQFLDFFLILTSQHKTWVKYSGCWDHGTFLDRPEPLSISRVVYATPENHRVLGLGGLGLAWDSVFSS